MPLLQAGAEIVGERIRYLRYANPGGVCPINVAAAFQGASY